MDVAASSSGPNEHSDYFLETCLKIRVAALAIAVVVSLGCSGDDLTGSSTINGAYSLRTINGSSLPFTTSGSGNDKTEVVDDVITLYEGGTYAESGHLRVTVSGTVTTVNNTETGSVVLLGNSVTLRSSDGLSSRIARIEANDMTIIDSGRTQIYRK